jgi:hypothetical protein
MRRQDTLQQAVQGLFVGQKKHTRLYPFHVVSIMWKPACAVYTLRLDRKRCRIDVLHRSVLVNRDTLEAFSAAFSLHSFLMNALIPAIGTETVARHEYAYLQWMMMTIQSETAFTFANVRANIKTKLYSRYKQDISSRHAWLSFVSALLFYYDDALLGGRLASCLLDNGIAVKVQLPRELFGDEPVVMPSNSRMLYLQLDASLWRKEEMCLDRFQMAFEYQFARIVATLVCGAPDQSARVARGLMGIDVPVSQNQLTRLPTVLVLHLANSFLTNADAVSLGSCDTQLFLQLRHTYLCRGVGGRMGTSPFVIGQVTTIVVDTSEQPTINLCLYPRLVDVRVDYLAHKTMSSLFPDTLTKLRLNGFKGSLHDIKFPSRLVSFHILLDYDMDRRSSEQVYDLQGMQWPSSLRDIHLGRCYPHKFSLRGAQFPPHLIKLVIRGVKLAGAAFPSSLLDLSLHDNDDVPFDDQLSLPDGLTSLHVSLLRSQAQFRFPRTLKSLYINKVLGNSDAIFLLPSLELLCLGTDFKMAHVDKLNLPPTLKTLSVKTYGLAEGLSSVLTLIQTRHPHLILLIESILLNKWTTTTFRAAS